MQNQNYQNGATTIRNNLNYVGPINKKMKEDAEQYQRKLHMSSSNSNNFKQNSNSLKSREVVTPIENNQNWGNGQQTVKTNAMSFSKGPQVQPTTQPRVLITTTEKHEDIVNRLSLQLSESNKQIHDLKKIISKKDESSRVALANLEATLKKMQEENEQLRVSQEQTLKIVNDKNSQPMECQRCINLQDRIRELEQQLNQLNQKYQREKQKNMMSKELATNLTDQLKITLKKITKMTKKISDTQNENLQLREKISKLQEKQITNQQEYNLLAEEFNKNSEQLARLNNSIKQLNDQNADKSSQIQSIETINKLQISQLQKNIQQLQLNYNFIYTERDQLVRQNQQLANSLTREKETNQSMKQEIYRKKAQIEEFNKYKIAELKQSDEQIQNQRLVEEISELTCKILTANSEKSQLSKALAQAQQSIEQLSQKEKNLLNEISKITLQTIQTNRNGEELSARNQQINSLYQQLKNAENYIGELTRQHEELIAKEDNSNQTILALNQTLTNKSKDLEAISNQVDQLTQQIQLSEKKAKNVDTKATSPIKLQNKLSEKQIQVQQSMEQQRKALEIITNDNNLLKQFNQQLIDTIQKMEEDLNHLQSENSKLQGEINYKNIRIQQLIADLQSTARTKKQQEQIQSIMKQNEDRLFYIGQLTQQLTQLEDRIASISKEKETIQNWIRQLEIRHQHSLSESLAYKNKLEEADNYIAEVLIQKNRLIGQIQQLQHQKYRKDTDKPIAKDESQIQAENVQLKQQIKCLTVELYNLKQERTIDDFRCKDNQMLIKLMQIQVNGLEVKSKEYQQKIQSLTNEKENSDLNTKKNNILIQELQLKIYLLNAKLSEAQKNITSPIYDESPQSLSEKVVELQRIIAELTNEAALFKNQLIQAEQFISRLLSQQSTKVEEEDSQNTKERIILLEKEVQRLNLERQQGNYLIAKQVQDSQIKVKALQADKKEAETKVKQARDSMKVIENSLNQFKTKVHDAEAQIAQLENQNIDAIRKAEESNQELNDIIKETESLRAKLIQAEGYINYIENLRNNQPQISNNDQSAELQRLIEELSRLQQKSRVLNLQKISAEERLQNNRDIIKNLQQNLDSQRIKLKEAEDHITFLSNQRQEAENKLREFQRLLNQANNEAAFFKDKLQQAEDYINSFNNVNNSIDQNQSQVEQKTQLISQVKALEEEKQLLQQLRKNSAIQSKNRQDLLKNLQKSVSELNSRVIEAEGRVTKFNEQKQIAEERARNSLPFETKFNEAVIEIDSLKVQITKLTNDLDNSKNLQIEFESEEKQLLEKIARLEKKIYDISQQESQKNSLLSRISKNDIRILTLQNQKKDSEAQLKKTQSELSYFKDKLIEAESYITQLEANNQEDPTQNIHLQQTVKKLKSQIMSLERDRKKLQGKIIFEKRLEQLESQSIFFKKKLLQAEQYITHLEQTRDIEQQSVLISVNEGQNEKNQQNSVEFVNKILGQLKEARKQLQIEQANANIRDQHHKQVINNLEYKLNTIKNVSSSHEQVPKDQKINNSSLEEAKLFKQKFLEAENYIAQLQKEINEASERGEGLQIYITELQKKNNESNVKVEKVESQIAELQQGNIEVNQKAKKLESYIAELQQASNNMKDRAEELKRYIGEVQQERNEASDKAEKVEFKVRILEDDVANISNKLMSEYTEKQTILSMNKQLTEENDKLKTELQSLITISLQDTEKNQLKLLITQLNNQLSFQKSKALQQMQKQTIVESSIDKETSEFFKVKLSEAETYIAYLQQESQNNNNAIYVLNHQLQKLRKELSAAKEANSNLIKNNQQRESLILQMKELTHWDQHINSLKLNQSRSGQRLSPLKEKVQLLEKRLLDEKEVSARNAHQAISKGQLLKQHEYQEQKVKDEIMKLQGMISELQNQNKSLKGELLGVNEEVSHLRDALIQLQTNQTILQNENQQINRDNTILNNIVTQRQYKLQQVQAQNKEIIIEIETYTKQLEELRNMVKSKDNQISELYIERRNGGERFRESMLIVDKLRAEVSDLHEKIRQKNNQTANNYTQNELFGQQVKDKDIHSPIQETPEDQDSTQFFKEKLHEAEMYISELQEKNENINSAILTLENQVKVLKTDVNNLNQKLLTSDHEKGFFEEKSYKLSQSLIAQSAKISQLWSKINILQNELEYRTKQYQEEQVEAYAKSSEILQKQKEMHRNDIQLLTSSLQNEQAIIRQLEVDKQKLQKRVQDCQNWTSNLNRQVDNQRIEVAVLKEKQQKLQGQVKALTDENADLKRQAQICQVEQAQLSDQLGGLHYLLEAKEKDILYLKQLNAANQQLVVNRLYKQEEKQKSENKLTVSPQLILNIQGQLEDSFEKEADLTKELTRQIQSLTIQLQRKDEEIRQLQVDKFNNEMELRDLMSRIQQLQQQNINTQLENSLAETERINLQLEEDKRLLINQIESLEKEKVNLMSNNQKYEQKVQEQGHKINQLQLQLRGSDITIENIIKGSQNQCQQTEEKLKEVFQQKYQIQCQQIQTLTKELTTLKSSISQVDDIKLSSPPHLSLGQKDGNREQQISELEGEIDYLRVSENKLKEKIYQSEAEKQQLFNQLRDAERRIHQLAKVESEQALRNQLLLTSNLSSPEVRVNTEESQVSSLREEELSQTVRKIIEMTNNYTEDIQPLETFSELDSFPYLSELINSILYRLRLSSAIDVEKSVKINKLAQALEIAHNKAKQTENMRWQIDEIGRENDELQHNNRDLTNQLQKYSEANHELSNQVSYITEQLDVYKEKIQFYQRKLAENREKNADSSSINDRLYLQFLYTCLDRITTLQDQVEKIGREIERIVFVEQINQEVQHGLEESPSMGSRDDLLKEINTLNNAVEIYHQESTRRRKEYQLSIQNMLKDLCELKYRYDELNEQKENDEINERINELGLKMKVTLDNEENEELDRLEVAQHEGEQEEFTSTNNYASILNKENEKRENFIGQEGIHVGRFNVEEVSIQTDEDTKPFLNYLLNVRDLDKEDILLLKKKISSMKAKDVDDNMRILQGQEQKLYHIIMENNIQSTPHQIENIMLTLAHNLSRDEISHIFSSDDSDQILKKLNEALCLEDSYLHGQNPTIIMRAIQERMMKYYEKPTRLSEGMYSHLISILIAKTQNDFYNEVEGFFRELSQIQREFEAALNKKDEVYRLHNERMNKIFNRSLSDVSEDYLSGFDGQADESEIHMASASKYRGSDLDSYNFTGRERQKS